MRVATMYDYMKKRCAASAAIDGKKKVKSYGASNDRHKILCLISSVNELQWIWRSNVVKK